MMTSSFGWLTRKRTPFCNLGNVARYSLRAPRLETDNAGSAARIADEEFL
jgi:hypothetical protein